MLAAIPAGSSVEWFGCSRIANRPGKPIVLRKRRHHPAFAGDQNEILIPADFADGSHHLGCQARRDAGQYFMRC